MATRNPTAPSKAGRTISDMSNPSPTPPADGYKLALPAVDWDRAEGRVVGYGWVGLSSPIPYGTGRQQAECPRNRSHQPPVDNCVCGFMASHTREHLATEGEAVRKAMMLAARPVGQVISYEKGWRAAEQQVWAAAAPRLCPRCGEEPTSGAGWFQQVRAHGVNFETRVLEVAGAACLEEAELRWNLAEMAELWDVNTGTWDPPEPQTTTPENKATPGKKPGLKAAAAKIVDRLLRR